MNKSDVLWAAVIFGLLILVHQTQVHNGIWFDTEQLISHESIALALFGIGAGIFITQGMKK